MTNRRRREVEKLVTDLGLVITGFRTNGNSHWRVDIQTPDGNHQRPFTFPTSGHDGARRYDELSMLKRWRREVAPELEVSEEAGTLRPGKVTSLGEKLEKLGIGLHKEAPPDITRVRVVPHEVVATIVQPVVPPPASGATWTPEQALERALGLRKEPEATVTVDVSQLTHKETLMSAQTTPIENTDHTPRGPDKRKRREMSFSDVMKFAAWMNKDRLDGYISRSAFLEHAAHALSLHVSEEALRQWLNDNGVEFPAKPVRYVKEGDGQLGQDLAVLALALADFMTFYREAPGASAHRHALLEIVERRTSATTNTKA